MDDAVRQLCEEFLSQRLTSKRLVQRCLQLASSPTAGVQLDVQRSVRCGFPEVIFGEGKSLHALEEIVSRLRSFGQDVLATRLNHDQQQHLAARFPQGVLEPIGRTFRWMSESHDIRVVGKVAVLTAGTGDRPVAREATETLSWMRVGWLLIEDVGVAGPHRLPAHLDQLEGCDAAIVIAGMEGALPSVAGGYLDCPVFAVPTSVGYGTSFQGLTALLGMLNSCAANVSVVNIDAGFKGGYLAGMVARRRWDGDAATAEARPPA